MAVAEHHVASDLPHVRARSLRILVLVRGRCGAQPLLAALEDKSPEVRARAALEVARLGLATARAQRAARSVFDATPEPPGGTCGMHPQIHLDEAGPRPICGMDLVRRAGGSPASGIARAEALAALLATGESAAAGRLVALALRDGGDVVGYVALSLLRANC